MPLATTYGPNSVTTSTDRISVPTFQAPQGGGGLDLTGIMNEMLRQKRRSENQMQSQAIIGTPGIRAGGERLAAGREGPMSQAAVDDHRKFMMNAERQKQQQLLGGAPMQQSQVGTQLIETPNVNRMSAVQREAFLPGSSAVTGGGFSLGELANQDARLIGNRPATAFPDDGERADFFGHGTTNREQQQRMMQLRALGLR